MSNIQTENMKLQNVLKGPPAQISEQLQDAF